MAQKNSFVSLSVAVPELTRHLHKLLSPWLINWSNDNLCQESLYYMRLFLWVKETCFYFLVL